MTLPNLGNRSKVYAQTSPATSQRAIVGAQAATLQATPGGESLRTLLPGTVVLIHGRTTDSQWVQGETADSVVGWLATEPLILFGLEKLPIAAAAPVTVAAVPAQGLVQAATALSATATLSTTVVATATTAPVNPADAQGIIAPNQATVMATVAVTEGRLNARSGPATDYRIIAKLMAGQSFAVSGQSADGQWLLLDLTDEAQGWVSATYVTVSGSLDAAPVTAAVITTSAASPSPATTNTTVAASSSTPATNGNATGLQGTLVFQASQGGAIYLYNLTTGELRPLTSGSDPALSPDGTKVVFTRSGGDNGLYLINRDGSGERRIFGEQDQLSSPKWSPDGQWIVFSRSAGHWDCYQQGPQCVTRQALLSRLPPNVANDPEAVAQFLDQFDVVENPNWSLARVNASGAEYRDLPALDSARTPDWSAGGIVYQSTAGLQKTADTADSENQVVVAGHHLQDPDWRPDGGRIVYQARRGDHWEIFSVNPDGSDNGALTRPVTTLVDQLPSNVAPDWSPDGQFIVYLSNRDENNSAGAWRLWSMNADGSDQRPLPIELSINYTGGLEQMASWGE